ncbi:MAG: hypothetical protein P8174_12080, partial [Gemmatimonadota bacterium]
MFKTQRAWAAGRRTRIGRRRIAPIVACLAVLVPGSLAAQQPPAQPRDTTHAAQQPPAQPQDTANVGQQPRTASERALDRLRSLPQQPLVVRPDTAPPDTAAADSAKRAAQQGAVPGRPGLGARGPVRGGGAAPGTAGSAQGD